MGWLEDFRRETDEVVAEPFLRCLAEAIAVVESDHGRRAITGPEGLNEIGYKAVANQPSHRTATREADGEGRLIAVDADFRLFHDRAEQGRALLWLLRTSRYYEAARLLFILTFYAAYAPGRDAGARALVRVFNELAASGAHEGVRPLLLAAPGQLDAETAELNHAAARQAVRLFAELTSAPDHDKE